MIRVTDQYFWNVIFSIFFLALLAMAAIILESESRIPYDELTLIDYTILILATWRVIRLFTKDTLTRFFREQFWDVVKVGRGHRLEKPKTGPRRTIADLLACPWCFGPWAATMVTFFYLITPLAVFPILILALSAVGTFLQLLASLVGNVAEKTKIE